MNSLQLRPSHWASVSGGKDSLYMLKLILSRPDIYPLDGVVHFELDIDYPFIKNVVDYMERECMARGIRFVRIKPAHPWEFYYNRYGFPTRTSRWCNSSYKLSAQRNLKSYMRSLGYNVIFYIGYCFDEVKRYEKRSCSSEVYPLVEFGVFEEDILQWAKTVDLFNNYYLFNRRCGCMYCPMASMLNYAYLAYFYPAQFNYMIDKMRFTEQKTSLMLGRSFSCTQSNGKYNAEHIVRQVYSKYIPKIVDILNSNKIPNKTV